MEMRLSCETNSLSNIQNKLSAFYRHQIFITAKLRYPEPV